MNAEDSGLYGDGTKGSNGAGGPEFPRQEPVAIIGMACRFPGGYGLSDFWRQLAAGKSAVVEGPPWLGNRTRRTVRAQFPRQQRDAPLRSFSP